jgi:hypothetical protein
VAEPLRHYAVTVSRRRLRDWFRKSYWVRCWKCEVVRGPYFDLHNARVEERYQYGFMQNHRPQCDARAERGLL